MSDTTTAPADDACDCSTCNPRDGLMAAFQAASDQLPKEMDAGELSLFIHGTIESFGLNATARGELLLNTLLVGNIEAFGPVKGHEATVKLIEQFVRKLAERLIGAVALQVSGLSPDAALEAAASAEADKAA